MAKYKQMIDACVEWVRQNGLMYYGGATLTDFLREMSIDASTYYAWLEKPEFAEAIKNAREVFKRNQSNEIALSLSRLAKGYDVTQTTTEFENDNGTKKIKKQTQKSVHVPPSVPAAIFLLTNIDPEHYKNRQTVEGKQEIETSVKFKGFDASLPATPSDEELDKEIEKNRKAFFTRYKETEE